MNQGLKYESTERNLAPAVSLAYQPGSDPHLLSDHRGMWAVFPGYLIPGSAREGAAPHSTGLGPRPGACYRVQADDSGIGEFL